MITRKPTEPRPLPADWHVSDELTINGRRIKPGTELSIEGVRGRVRFMRHVRRDNGTEWVDVLTPRAAGWRSFRPERIKTVHTRARLGKAC